MSDDADSQPPSFDRSPSPGRSVHGAVQAGNAPEQGPRQQPSDSVRRASVDRGGSPIDNPSPTHWAVAARDRPWNSYQGKKEDGCFVWTVTDGEGGGRGE